MVYYHACIQPLYYYRCSPCHDIVPKITALQKVFTISLKLYNSIINVNYFQSSSNTDYRYGNNTEYLKGSVYTDVTVYIPVPKIMDGYARLCKVMDGYARLLQGYG